MATAVTPEPKIKYGPQVSTNGVPNLFEPQTVTPFTPPPPGIDHVRSIPPAGNPGKGQIYQMLPLYDIANPDAEPVAYLTSLSFRMGTYLPEQEGEPAAS